MTVTMKLTEEETKRLIDAYFIVLDKYVKAMNETESDKVHFDLWNEMVDLLQRFKPIIQADSYIIERDIGAKNNFFVPYTITFLTAKKKQILTFDFS